LAGEQQLTGAIEAGGTIAAELGRVGDRAAMLTTAQKKNYAEAFSRALAQRLADELRAGFPGILPDAEGRGQESRARSAKGIKKLDVNYSTVELGLGLGVSIKTINFRDAKTKRYTKNYTRADGELRAEASDYHVRQPYAVLVGIVFLPLDSCDDGTQSPSSFGQAVTVFRFRAGRDEPSGDPNLFERVFIGLYGTDPESYGSVGFFDVMDPPPRNGRPAKLLSMAELIQAIQDTYDARNSPVFEWADSDADRLTEPVSDPDEDDTDAEP
jgi:hypothetical protein